MFWPQVAGTSYDMRPDQFRYVDKRIQELGEVVRRKVFDWEENESGLGEVKVRIYFMQTPAGEVVYALSIDSWTPREKNNGFVRAILMSFLRLNQTQLVLRDLLMIFLKMPINYL